MYKKIIFGVYIVSITATAHAQYDVQKFGSELQSLKSRIEQKKIPVAVRPFESPAPAMVPDSISADQPAMLSRQISACQNTMDSMAKSAQKKVKRSESWAIAGAITGLLGSIGSGHISTLLVGLLSGTAGLANTVQQVYKDHGDTPESVLSTRSGIRKQAIVAIDEYTKATDDDARYDAMIKLHFSCAMYEMTSEEKLPTLKND
jgi:hypothetical protein